MFLAIPKGRLLPDLLQVLRGCGFDFVYHDRCYQLVINHPAGFQAIIVKPRAIPQLIALGKVDAGFCGLDILAEADYDECQVVTELGLNKVEIVVAQSSKVPNLLLDPPRRPLVIATEYVNLADRWATGKGLAHITVQSWGATEGYVPRLADLIFDCRETGATIKANGLVTIDKIMDSSTCFVVNKSYAEANVEEISAFVKLLTENLGG